MAVKVVLAGWVQDGLYDPWHPMSLTLQDMAALGINVVFPAGNAGPTPSDCSTPANCHITQWSASYPTITVAATPKRSRTVLESYSSRGDPNDHTFHDETFRYQPTLAAPGTNVVAARRVGLAGAPAQTPGSLSGAGGDASILLDRRYVPLTGTSVSAAHVAGAIAVMQQGTFRNHGCFLTPWQVTNILQSTATAIPGASSTDVGAGMINVTKAVQMAAVWPPDRWLC
jgi:serine protease AprX